MNKCFISSRSLGTFKFNCTGGLKLEATVNQKETFVNELEPKNTGILYIYKEYKATSPRLHTGDFLP